MLIKYTFADGTVSEVEVDDDLGKVMEQMKADEDKFDRRETRRHKYICRSWRKRDVT